MIDTTADGSLYRWMRAPARMPGTRSARVHHGRHQTFGPLARGQVFSGRGCEPLATSGPADCVITAHDALTGRELWRTRTIPGPGEAGNETWGDVPYAERKHVGAWMPPSYDPELKLLYIGTSVTSPAPKYLLGGNDRKHLYHNSTLALDPETGKIVWYYQHVVDHWDFDHTFERILIDTEVTPAKESVAWINPDIRPGQVQKVITGIPGKTGIVYTLDRRTGKFLWATPTIRQEAVESINGRTGEVKVKPASLFQKKGDAALLCPSMIGGKNWPAGAYSPLTKTMYFPLQNTCATLTVVIDSRKEPSSYGIRADAMLTPGTTNLGSIHAISAVTGRTEWKYEQRAGTTSLVTTGGGLLFGGDAAGRFRAFDQRTGQILWQTNLGSQVTGFPISFAVGDRQYIAVSTGSAVSTAGHLQLTPEIRSTTTNNLYVFALPEGWQTARTPPRPIAAPVAVVAATPAAVPLACRQELNRMSRPAAAGTPVLPDGRFSLRKVQARQDAVTASNARPARREHARHARRAGARRHGFRAAWKGLTVQPCPPHAHARRCHRTPGRDSAMRNTSASCRHADANGSNPARAPASRRMRGRSKASCSAADRE